MCSGKGIQHTDLTNANSGKCCQAAFPGSVLPVECKVSVHWPETEVSESGCDGALDVGAAHGAEASCCHDILCTALAGDLQVPHIFRSDASHLEGKLTSLPLPGLALHGNYIGTATLCAQIYMLFWQTPL